MNRDIFCHESYEYRYLNGIYIAVSQNNKIFLIKNQKLLYQHSQITVLISLMTPYRSTSLFLVTGLRPCLQCLVSLCTLPITYFSRWRHECMRSSNSLTCPQQKCAVRSSKCLPLLSYNRHRPRLNQRCGKTLVIFLCYFLPFVNC